MRCSRYRRLIRKTISTTIRRSPREPGQTNQPPPLEYPATRHPESPKVATEAANMIANFAKRVDVESTLCRFRTSNSVTLSQRTLDHVLDFRNHRADGVGYGLSRYRNHGFPAPVHQIGRHEPGNYGCVHDYFAQCTMRFDLFLCRHMPPLGRS